MSRLQPWVFRLATLCVQAGAAALYADEACMCYLVITPARWERLLFTRVEFYGTLFSASTHKRSLRRRKE